MSKVFPRPGRLCVWAISMYSGKSPFELNPIQDIPNPSFTAGDISDIKADFVADPFVLCDNGKWYLFFEVLNSKTCLGEIALAKSDDGLKWVYGGVILRQNTHMSYPYVFEHGGVKYMVPETFAQGNVSLYRSDAFPDGWKLDKVLIDEPLYDSSVVYYEGIWYLFGSTADYDLRLFYSADLHGQWKEHPDSPVIKKNAQFARPAGRIIHWQGNLYRFVQDCRGSYGTAVYAMKINKLNPKEYNEELACNGVPVIAGSGKGWNAVGMHTICAQEVEPGHWIAAVDGYYKRWGIKRY